MHATTPAIRDMILLVNRQGETVRVGGGRVLVASKSQPGRWYDVTDGYCTCPGYFHRHTCRHLAAAPQPPEPPPPSAPASCPRCHRATRPQDARSLEKFNECARCLNESIYGPEVA